jgi:hypothetical protein
MATYEDSPKVSKDVEATSHPTDVYDDTSTLGKGDILALEHVDPVLNAKMRLVNNAIDEIGFTAYHWNLFFLNGFG